VVARRPKLTFHLLGEEAGTMFVVTLTIGKWAMLVNTAHQSPDYAGGRPARRLEFWSILNSLRIGSSPPVVRFLNAII
jgi:hypothetical protein